MHFVNNMTISTEIKCILGKTAYFAFRPRMIAVERSGALFVAKKKQSWQRDGISLRISLRQLAKRQNKVGKKQIPPESRFDSSHSSTHFRQKYRRFCISTPLFNPYFPPALRHNPTHPTPLRPVLSYPIPPQPGPLPLSPSGG